MPHVYGDRIKESSTSTGTGDFTLGGAVSSYRAFSVVCTNGDTVFYTIQNRTDPTQWEVGLGTWTTGGVLQRTLVKSSSNSGSAVNFSIGDKYVWLDLPAIGGVMSGNIGSGQIG